jgi:spermidine synthase
MTGAAPADRQRPMLALFLVSAAAVGYEIALTRYFAVAKWSEYGYWVISIVMAGFALSGVVLALARDAFARRAAWVMPALPALMIVAAALGFYATVANPFNPLQLQNAATWQPQIANIALYYLGLLPFFFLAGLFIGLSFVLHPRRVGLVYGFDLTGAGFGAALVLALMFVIPPFHLVPALLVLIAGGAVCLPGRRFAGTLAAVLALLAGEALLLGGPQAEFNDFKAIYAPLHTQGAQVAAQILSPRGQYTLLDDFTERVDTDVSNNAGMLGLPGPPTSFGLYRDGNRIASLPRPGAMDSRYAAAGLDAAPYLLRPHPDVLLAGVSGGFRIRAVLTLGAAHIDALEPEPILLAAVRDGMGKAPAWAADKRVRLLGESPVAAAQGGERYDVIDIASDFMEAAEANVASFTAEAMALYVRALKPDGMVSIPVSIRDFPVYALRMLATARAGLLEAGIADPARHVMIYRSAWNVRILVSRRPWQAAEVAALRKWCDDRSFDVSYYPGMDPKVGRDNIYNDLPAVSFSQGEVESNGPDDAIADEALAVLTGQRTESQEAFRLSPVTFDRPFFYAVLRLSQLGTLLQRLEILPQQEIGALVNLAVLAQAVVLAALVLLVPVLAPGRIRGRTGRERAPLGTLLRAIVYFPALGLGFLWIELYLIERASFYLADRTSGFALVLTGMLVFSGLGSLLGDRLAPAPRRGMAIAAAVVVAWGSAVGVGVFPAMLGSLDWPWLLRALLVLALVAPVSVALGIPFPLGLGAVTGGGASPALLPWAWGLNGAFSVLATPLANLVAREAGFSRVLLGGTLLYVLAAIAFPTTRKSVQWQDLSARSHAAD